MNRTCPAAMKLFLSLTLFTLAAIANVRAQTEKVLYIFTGGADGGTPYAGLIADSKGNFYGTTNGGGSPTCGCGTVFELSPGSNGSWTEKVLYSFLGGEDGTGPYGGLIFDGKGNLYGTTIEGGSYGLGTVFELTPGTNGIWTEKVLHSFNVTDGALPYGGVVQDSAGNLYGSTYSGGVYLAGTVYELTPGSNGYWKEKVLYSFTGVNDGSAPESPLIFDGAGNLYGTTPYAGPNDYGSVFELMHGSNGNWTLKTIYAFTGVSGLSSSSGLVFDSTGDLYGTTQTTAFELTPGSNGTWTEKTLHGFTGGADDGASAYSGLIFDKAGHLYGATSLGGLHHGTVFELKPGANGSWSEKILHRFAAGADDGSFPLFGNLVVDSSGNLYGTTIEGGPSDTGVVYEITP
jgi:uncharacterized repeat protein (TIGR03803 family)